MATDNVVTWIGDEPIIVTDNKHVFFPGDIVTVNRTIVWTSINVYHGRIMTDSHNAIGIEKFKTVTVGCLLLVIFYDASVIGCNTLLLTQSGVGWVRSDRIVRKSTKHKAGEQ